MRYKVRFHYRIRTPQILDKFKERFNVQVSINYESTAITDEEGYRLLLESERLNYITIRQISWK